ncbi:substance-P receptor-like [Asterias rubens]|uniref:substance-P receptor-like n=1 Tax=Asterias rubens TaxID=7604 RepID=UPI001455BAD6|nr:substance-P receptor-like [Asterias rubens]
MESNNGFATALNVTIACSAILGNGLVIFVMTVRREQFSSFTNRLIRHQSIIDFLSGLVFLLMTGIIQSSLLENVEINFSGWILCRLIFSNFFVWGLSVASTYNLVVISLERFLATCYPVKHRNYCSLFKINVSMCVAWIIGFIYAVMYIFLYKVNGNRCGFNRSISPTALNIVFCVTVFVEYIVPVILISFSYVRILLVLRNKLFNANANQQDGVFSKAKRNVIMTMLIAGCMFFICWTPTQTLRFLLTIGVVTRRTSSFTSISLAFTGLIMCNMSVNPVVYCFKYEHFRTQLKQLVRGRFGRSRVRPGVESNDAPSLAIDPIQQSAITQAM